MKPKDLEETEEKDVILGTFMMASEGFDCKYPLNTIFLTSPKKYRTSSWSYFKTTRSK